jgi:rod shape-determining protein MreD
MSLAVHQGGLFILITFLVSLLLTVLPLPDWSQHLRPPWVALVLIYWCIALPERVGVGVAWVVGIFLDVLTGALFGQHALGLLVVAYMAVTLHQRMRLFPLWQQSLIVLIMLLVDRLLVLWVAGAAGQPPPSLWYWMPAITGMLLWPWMFIMLRGVRRRFRVS